MAFPATRWRSTARTADGERKIEGSHLFVAVGRVPNAADIGLDRVGVELDGRGFIRVNERLQTSAPGVWAIGECAGSPQFTHISVDDFRIVADNMAGGARVTSDRMVPYVMFTDPPLARVGLSEVEAARQGLPVRVGRLPMSNVLRTEATDEKLGFMKAIVGVNDDRILGFAMIGAEAGEVMAAVQTAMMAELPYPKLRDAVFSHLTMAEGLGSLLSKHPASIGLISTSSTPAEGLVGYLSEPPRDNVDLSAAILMNICAADKTQERIFGFGRSLRLRLEFERPLSRPSPRFDQPALPAHLRHRIARAALRYVVGACVIGAGLRADRQIATLARLDARERACEEIAHAAKMFAERSRSDSRSNPRRSGNKRFLHTLERGQDNVGSHPATPRAP